VRPPLTVDRLEDRLAPSVSKPPYPDPAVTVPYTSTELLAQVTSPNPLTDVANVVSYLNLSQFVDPTRTAVVFGTSGKALVSIGLQPGVNPLAVAHTLTSAAGVISWVSPNYVYPVVESTLEQVPNDPLYGQQWHLPLINAPAAWDTTYGSPGVTVAVLDDGFDMNHPDLVTNWARNPGEIAGGGIDNDHNGFVEDVFGWNFVQNNNDTSPDNPKVDVHGTEVAGLIAARVDNALGVAGVAGRVTILPEKVVGNGALTSLNLARAAAYAVSRGAKIITNSTNIDQLVNDPVFTAAVDFVYDKGLIWVNSAGNANAANPPRVAFDQMLLVAATDRTDHKTDYSNYGSGIDISAPGGTATDGLLTTVPLAAGGYGFAYGTSMAAPIVAAAAALVWSAHPGFTRDQVVSRLSATADDLNLLNPNYQDQLGSGRVNVGAAVNAPNVTSHLGAITGLPADGVPSPVGITTFTLHLPNPLDVSSVTISSFDLREAGPDGQFDTGDDVAIPFTINNGRPYYYGTNDLTFTAYGLEAEGHYRFTAKANDLKDPFGNPVDGGNDLVYYFGVGPQVTGHVFEDDAGDGTDDPTDPGVGGTEVFIDNNGNGQLDQSTFGTQTDELAIPDADSTGVSSTINVTGINHPITRTTVTVTLRHPYPSDLVITLTSPDGKVITLLRNRFVAVTPGLFTLTFDDAAGSDTVPDAAGRIRPDEPLSGLFGDNANGPWTLSVADTTPQDTGSLVGWSITIADEPVAVSNPDGSFALPGTNPGAGQSIRVVPGSSFAPVPDAIGVTDSGSLAVGLVRPGAVYGRVLLDNGDLTYSPQDPGFAGATVYVDLNGDGLLDAGDPSAVTDRYGNFVLTGLAAGTYTLRVSGPRAFSVLSPLGGGRTITVTAGETSHGNDFLLQYDPTADHPLALPVTPDLRNTPVGSVTFDLASPLDGLTLANLSLTRDGVAVPLTGATLVGSGTHYALIGLDPITAAEGRYQVQLSLAGTSGGTTGQSTSPPAVGTWTVDTTPPTATIDPTTTGLVRLSKPINGLTIGNFTLNYFGTPPPGVVADPVPVSLAGVTLSTNGLSVQLNGLSPLMTNSGKYVLTLTPSPGVTDAAGNPLGTPATVTYTVRPKAVDRFVVAEDAGGSPLITAYDPLSGAVIWRVYAYESTFSGGVRVTTADVNGDGVADVIVAPGPGRPADVRVFNGKDGTLLFDFLAFEPTFTGGAFVAAADLTGNGLADIVVTPDVGGGPRVRVFANGGQTVLADFYGIDDPNFRGGLRPALGDLNHDGTPDLVVSAGYGGGPRIAGYDGAALAAGRPVKLFADFFAFEPTLRNGAFVAVGDISGNGFADLVTAGGPGGGPRVQIFDGQTLVTTGSQKVVANFFAGDPNNRTGVRVAMKDLDGDGIPDLLTGSGQSTTVRGYLSANLLTNPNPTPDRMFDAFPTFTGGIYVG
jgi:subtilisin family serine protease/subtilisin-like proprotein convertase family protein